MTTYLDSQTFNIKVLFLRRRCQHWLGHVRKIKKLNNYITLSSYKHGPLIGWRNMNNNLQYVPKIGEFIPSVFVVILVMGGENGANLFWNLRSLAKGSTKTIKLKVMMAHDYSRLVTINHLREISPRDGLFIPCTKSCELRRGITWGINTHNIHTGEVLMFYNMYI